MMLTSANRLLRLLKAAAAERLDAAEDLPSGRFILDRHKRLGDFSKTKVEINTGIAKEEDARRILFDPATPGGVFFEAGGRDGDLTYLLGIRQNLEYDQAAHVENRRRFDAKFQYIGNDLSPDPTGRALVTGDLCSPTFLEDSGFAEGFAAVAYSNNVFEHLRRPWIAARNLYRTLQPGGVGITVVPFAQRYHESPGDYFRYTHAGIAALFEDAGPLEPLAAGYDILGRRNDWQGQGQVKDIVPVDSFGAWRETWFTFHAFRKPVGAPQR